MHETTIKLTDEQKNTLTAALNNYAAQTDRQDEEETANTIIEKISNTMTITYDEITTALMALEDYYYAAEDIAEKLTADRLTRKLESR